MNMINQNKFDMIKNYEKQRKFTKKNFYFSIV